MASVGELVVFIPERSHVTVLPVRSLPSSIARKMATGPEDSERPAVFISPVELRENSATPRPRPLTPGRILLPVVTSNRSALRTLQDFLRLGEISLQFSADSSRSAFSRRRNSIVLFNSEIFLIQPKAKAPDWPRRKRSSAPLEREAPPRNTPVTMNDDIAEKKRSTDGVGAAGDHGKCAEALQESKADAARETEEEEERLEAPTKDVSTNTPRIKLEKLGGGGGAAPGSGERGRANGVTSASGNGKGPSDDGQVTISGRSGAKAESRRCLVFTTAIQSRENEVKGQTSDSETRGANADAREDATETAAETKTRSGVQSDGGPSPSSGSAAEIIDASSTIIEQERTDLTHISRVENLLKKCERIQHRINCCVTSVGSGFEQKPLNHAAMEKSADLIIADGPDRRVSGGNHQADAVEIVELDEDVVIDGGEGVSSSGLRNGCKRRPEAEAMTDGANGSPAKWRKPDTDNVASTSQVQNEVGIIKVDDDDDDDEDGITVQRNEGNGGNEASGLESACEIIKLPGANEVRGIEVAVPQRNPQDHEDDLMNGEGYANGDAAGGRMEPEVPSEDAAPSLKEEPASSGENRQSGAGTCRESRDGEVLSAAQLPASDAGSEPQPAEGLGSPAASGHHEIAGRRSGATSQSVIRPHPVTRPEDYQVLKREENINRIRDRLRRMEEKLGALKNSH